MLCCPIEFEEMHIPHHAHPAELCRPCRCTPRFWHRVLAVIPVQDSNCRNGFQRSRSLSVPSVAFDCSVRAFATARMSMRPDSIKCPVAYRFPPAQLKQNSRSCQCTFRLSNLVDYQIRCCPRTASLVLSASLHSSAMASPSFNHFVVLVSVN